MDKQAIREELKVIIGDYLKNQGFDLIDLLYRYEGNALILRILADKPEGGISIDECARINNAIGSILDEKDILKERYILEVSSPGLDRPLSTKDDFLHCIGKKVKFFLGEPVDDKIELEGLVNKADDESVYIDFEGRILNISLSKITKAKQVIL